MSRWRLGVCTTAELYAGDKLKREKLKVFANNQRKLADGWTASRGKEASSQALGDNKAGSASSNRGDG